MKKRIMATLILCLMLALSGCGGGSTSNSDPIVGSWTAAGVFYEETVYSFEDVPALADLYDLETITINSDGTFSQLTHVWTVEGVWESFEVEGYDDAYTLQRKTIKQVGADEEETSDTVKIAFLVEGDSNLLMVTDSDGDDEMPLIYLRDGTTSALLSGGISTAKDTDDSYSYDAADSDDSDDSYSYDYDSDDSYSTYDSGSNYDSYGSVTSGEANALQKAWDYLDYMAFSYDGLIDQLEYEGFTYSEAKYAVDNCGADWYEQAAKKAQEYLDYMAFSRSELIDQLEYEGFTYDQASYGVDAVY